MRYLHKNAGVHGRGREHFANFCRIMYLFERWLFGMAIDPVNKNSHFMVTKNNIEPEDNKIKADIEAADQLSNEAATGPDDVIEIQSGENQDNENTTQKDLGKGSRP